MKGPYQRPIGSTLDAGLLRMKPASVAVLLVTG